MKTSRESFRGALEHLTAARDEARVGLHLLSLDARKKWDELEKQVASLEVKLGDRAEKMTEATAAKSQELATSVREFVNGHVRKRPTPS